MTERAYGSVFDSVISDHPEWRALFPELQIQFPSLPDTGAPAAIEPGPRHAVEFDPDDQAQEAAAASLERWTRPVRLADPDLPAPPAETTIEAAVVKEAGK